MWRRARSLTPVRTEAGGGARDAHAPRAHMIWLVALVAALACAALGAGWRAAPGTAFWFWLAACAAGETLWFRLPAGGATLSMAACFNLAAVLVLPVHEAMLATAVASLAAETLVMRKPAVRGLYNASHTALAAWAGASAAGAAGGLAAGPAWLWAALAAALAWYAVNRAAVTLAVAVHGGRSLAAAWRENFGSAREALYAGGVLSLGLLLGLHTRTFGAAGMLLVALPLVLAFDGYRRLADRRRTGAVPGRRPRRQAA